MQIMCGIYVQVAKIQSNMAEKKDEALAILAELHCFWRILRHPTATQHQHLTAMKSRCLLERQAKCWVISCWLKRWILIISIIKVVVYHYRRNKTSFNVTTTEILCVLTALTSKCSLNTLSQYRTSLATSRHFVKYYCTAYHRNGFS